MALTQVQCGIRQTRAQPDHHLPSLATHLVEASVTRLALDTLHDSRLDLYVLVRLNLPLPQQRILTEAEQAKMTIGDVLIVSMASELRPASAKEKEQMGQTDCARKQ